MTRLWLGVALLLLAGCNGQVSLQLATSGTLDSGSADVQHVRLAVTQVQLTDDAGNVTVFDSSDAGLKEFFDYDNGATLRLLDGQDVPLAHYVRVALLFDPDNAELVDANGDPWPISVPGAPSSADVDFSVGKKDDVQLYMNLDLRLSLADRTSTSNTWQLVPRLNAVDLASDASLTGTIAQAVKESANCLQGRTDPEGAAVYAYPAAGVTPYDESSTASPHPSQTTAVAWNADGTGSYAFSHLAPGSYTIALNCVASEDDPLTAQNQTFAASAGITLSDDEAATLDF